MTATLRNRRAVLALVVLVTAAVAGVLVSRLTARGDVREIELTARSMAFYAPGSDANPTLVVRPGERVRIVVRNETPGMVHDLSIDAFGVSTRLLNAGETGTLEFTAPRETGRHEYVCRPHSVMMRGVIEVR
ncbi:MAG TPA: plastocyanin/azurin family copper-binding protein [Vicinamibacterales bacterium]